MNSDLPAFWWSTSRGVELPLSAVNELAEVCEPGVTLIATGDRNDVGLFRELIGNGVSDYLVKPITAPLLQRSLLNVMDSTNQVRPSDRRGRLVAVAGTRGGVGTTTLATGIAWTIAQRRRRRAALVDLDLQYGNVALGLDLEPATGLREALEQPGRIDALFVDRAMIAYSDTLYVLSGERIAGRTDLHSSRTTRILIRELRNKFHFVIVDVPHQISAATRYILSAATDLVIVTDLSVSGIRDTLRQIAMIPAENAALSSRDRGQPNRRATLRRDRPQRIRGRDRPPNRLSDPIRPPIGRCCQQPWQIGSRWQEQGCIGHSRACREYCRQGLP